MLNLKKTDDNDLCKISANSKWLLFLFLMTANSACFSITNTTTPKDICAESATEEDLFNCRKQQQLDSDKIMTFFYNELYNNHLENEPKLALLIKKSQESWLAFRDANCKVQTYYSIGGRAFDVYWFDCLTIMNRARLMEIQNQISAP